MTDLHDLTALEQGALIARGELTPPELTEHYLDRVERLNEVVGAYVTVTAELARAQAAAAGRAAAAARREGRVLSPLHGVPVPVKDSVAVAGVRTTYGSGVHGGHVPTHDADVVSRLRQAGTVLLGRTNTPEFELSSYTENRVAPIARTPWDLNRSAGGSSGGAAAAVASGLAPVAHGSDSAGSIRIPASVCGLYGIKPSRGRVSTGPDHHDVSGLTTSGPLARTVADAAALLDVMTGEAPGAPFAAPAPPDGGFLGAASRAPGRLRVALVTTPAVPGVEVHPDCTAAVLATAALLSELGHEVVPAELPKDGLLGRVFPVVWSVLATLHRVPPGAEAELMPLTRHLRRAGAGFTGHEFAEGVRGFRVVGERLAAAFADHDVILTPTLAQPPLAVGELRNDADPAAELAGMVAWSPFTALYNVTGRPAVTLPLHWTVDGLPVGVMLGGRYGDEGTLISLSAQLEAARPWAERKPPVWVRA
ncbi:amidase [Streptacidiphilus jiangxiensis]|uniref:Amidase n=1 Tax=Streptacidiphilus jiangxiensis TaxID=235985 RepID=A0A1H7VN41_STRJI|nr:amidase [Streptacidiphilus jiangxiensis]SEM10227.1 amidase [Streptacidiphilus jiangxiensis]